MPQTRGPRVLEAGRGRRGRWRWWEQRRRWREQGRRWREQGKGWREKGRWRWWLGPSQRLGICQCECKCQRQRRWRRAGASKGRRGQGSTEWRWRREEPCSRRRRRWREEPWQRRRWRRGILPPGLPPRRGPVPGPDQLQLLEPRTTRRGLHQPGATPGQPALPCLLLTFYIRPPAASTAAPICAPELVSWCPP